MWLRCVGGGCPQEVTFQASVPVWAWCFVFFVFLIGLVSGVYIMQRGVCIVVVWEHEEVS